MKEKEITITKDDFLKICSEAITKVVSEIAGDEQPMHGVTLFMTGAIVTAEVASMLFDDEGDE